MRLIGQSLITGQCMDHFHRLSTSERVVCRRYKNVGTENYLVRSGKQMQRQSGSGLSGFFHSIEMRHTN